LIIILYNTYTVIPKLIFDFLHVNDVWKESF